MFDRTGLQKIRSLNIKLLIIYLVSKNTKLLENIIIFEIVQGLQKKLKFLLRSYFVVKSFYLLLPHAPSVLFISSRLIFTQFSK